MRRCLHPPARLHLLRDADLVLDRRPRDHEEHIAHALNRHRVRGHEREQSRRVFASAHDNTRAVLPQRLLFDRARSGRALRVAALGKDAEVGPVEVEVGGTLEHDLPRQSLVLPPRLAEADLGIIIVVARRRVAVYDGLQKLHVHAAAEQVGRAGHARSCGALGADDRARGAHAALGLLVLFVHAVGHDLCDRRVLAAFALDLLREPSATQFASQLARGGQLRSRIRRALPRHAIAHGLGRHRVMIVCGLALDVVGRHGGRAVAV